MAKKLLTHYIDDKKVSEKTFNEEAEIQYNGATITKNFGIKGDKGWFNDSKKNREMYQKASEQASKEEFELIMKDYGK